MLRHSNYEITAMKYLVDMLRGNQVKLVLISYLSYTSPFPIQTLTQLDLERSNIEYEELQCLTDSFKNSTVSLIISPSHIYVRLLTDPYHAHAWMH